MMDSMASKERIEKTIQHQHTDKVPIHHVGYSCGVASALLGREAFVGGGSQQWREAVAYWQGDDSHTEFIERSYRDALDVAIATDNDLLRIGYWRYDRKPTKRIDENTFLYEYGPEENWRILRYDPESEQCDILDYVKRPPATFDSIEREVLSIEKQALNYHPGTNEFAFEIRALREVGQQYDIRIGGVSVGLPLRGIEIWLEALILRPDLVTRYLDAQVEIAKQNVAYLAPLGFRHFWGGLDFASNEGPMFSPKLFRDIILPRVKQVTAVCHQYGAKHFFASDGEFWSVTDMLFGEKSVDGYFEIDGRAGMDLAKLRNLYPELILVGNISSHTVHLGSKTEIIEETISALEAAKNSTGIIVGLSNYFVPGTPYENVQTIIETIQKYR